MTPEEELLDPVALSVLRNLMEDNNSDNTMDNSTIHDNTSTELDADDGAGQQGGLAWRPPTSSPSEVPSANPFAAPTVSRASAESLFLLSCCAFPSVLSLAYHTLV